MQREYLEAGKIVGTHGVRGELRLEPWCDSAAFLLDFSTLYNKDGSLSYRVLSSRVHKSLLLLTLEGVTSIEQGDALRGRVLYFRRSDATLPEGRYFITDLIGLAAFDADTGARYGTLTEVYHTGANDVYQITDERGRDFLIPVIDEVVLDTDIAGGRLTIRPIKGIFDDAD